MSEQRQAAIRRLRREAELLRKAIELEFSRASARQENRPTCFPIQADTTTGYDVKDGRTAPRPPAATG